jgi:hypothetical protein
VNVLTDDDSLYDIFIDNHNDVALMEILSTQHFEKLNDKNGQKRSSDLLQKIDQGLEKTDIVTDIIEERPPFSKSLNILLLGCCVVTSWLAKYS